MEMPQVLEGAVGVKEEEAPPDKIACLTALKRKVLWLSTWMIHNANHLRPNRDGLKVGGHQASSASLATLMTALYFDVLRPQDRIAVQPHASPVFHAIQYLLGHQSREKLERFRAFGGAQSYPSRSKDGETVDFSTGSVGLGVGMTLFASLAQDYLRLKGLVPTDEPPGRMIALAGDAELDEGNIFEALLEGWKHDVRNLWWVIDYNRQSLDAHDDPALQRLMTNLAGHDMESVLDAFHGVGDDRPTCFIAYTIKGYGLPFAGHKDNHAGLMNRDQMASFQRSMAVADGAEWDLFAGLDVAPDRLSAFVAAAPLAGFGRRWHDAPRIAVPPSLATPRG